MPSDCKTTDPSVDNMRDGDSEFDIEWEEWDGSSPFLHHCLAGSIAGLAEHTLLYPVDTIKTHMQSYCADCPNRAQNQRSTIQSALSNNTSAHDVGMWRTMKNLVLHGGNNHLPVHHHHPSSTMGLSTRPATNIAVAACTETLSKGKNHATNPSLWRLWRGVQTMAIGCVPAHAVYFSSYEAVKSLFVSSNDKGYFSPFGSAVAGGTATVFHDVIMTPLDTVKQRLQLGYYEGSTHNALRQIIRHEGYISLFRSFPVTLLTNVPYGMVMVSTNEFLKQTLNPSGRFDMSTYLLSGCGAGFVASALTTPLDRVKTRLQTQNMGSVVSSSSGNIASSTNGVDANGTMKQRAKCGKLITVKPSVKYEGWQDAVRSIVREEGYIGLTRGMLPRTLMHAPAVAISWTSYECAKIWLQNNFKY